MVRVQKPGKQAASSGGLRGPKAAKQQQQQRKKHKVVLESDSADNSKPPNILSFRAEPPPGYTFIPAGNPELTAALKQFATKNNREIFAVTTTPHASRHELSREVHRVGFHFPTDVVADVCAYYGITLTNKGTIRDEKDDDQLFMRVYQKGQLVLDEEVRDQVTINTEAKQIIKDLFPNMPDNDLFKIIKTAFQLGDGKVGTADEIPLVRRAQLSVVAHIRHTYTNYDKLLRQVPYSEARHRVENETLQKLVDWRGDGDDNKQAMDDTLREVLVISDDEDSDDDVENDQILDKDDLRVHSVVRSSIQTSGLRGPTEVYVDDEPAQGYRYVPQVVRRLPLQEQHAVAASRQQSRYARWNQVRQEYRSSLAARPSEPVRIIERTLIDDPYATRTQPQFVAREPIYTQEPISRGLMDPPARIMQQTSQPSFIRGSDGKLYQEISANPPHPDPSMSYRARTPPLPSYPGQAYVSSRQVSPQVCNPPPHRRTASFENSDGTVLPSIEGPSGTVLSPASRRAAAESPQQAGHLRTFAGNEYDPRRPALIDLTHSAEQATKRRCLEVKPPSPYPKRQPQAVANGPDMYMLDQKHNADSASHPPRRIIDLTEQLQDGLAQGGKYSSATRFSHEQHYIAGSNSHSTVPRSFENIRPMSPTTSRDRHILQADRSTRQDYPSTRALHGEQSFRSAGESFPRRDYGNMGSRLAHDNLPLTEMHTRIQREPAEHIVDERDLGVRYVRTAMQYNGVPQVSGNEHSFREYTSSSASYLHDPLHDHHPLQVPHPAIQYQSVPTDLRPAPSHRNEYGTRSTYVLQ